MKEPPFVFSPEEYGFVLFILSLAALISFYYFVRDWKRWHLIKDTPTARLRSAHQGYIELAGKGKPVPDQPIFSPLSNHRCIWYHSMIEHKEVVLGEKRTRTKWEILYQHTSDQAFLLDDGTGSCLVNPKNAEITSNEKLIWHGDTEWPTRTQVLDNDSAIVAMTKRYRYSEQLILPGQQLYILGYLHTRSPATEQSVQNITRDLLDDWKQNQQQLLECFDTNQDGEIDQAEWEIAREAAQSQARTLHQQLLHELEIHHISRLEDDRRPFIISVHPQTELIRKYRRHALFMLTVSLGMMGCAAWLLRVHG